MGTESKNVKVTRQPKQQQKSAGVCRCGQELKWVKYSPHPQHGRMRRYCEACFWMGD